MQTRFLFTPLAATCVLLAIASSCDGETAHFGKPPGPPPGEPTLPAHRQLDAQALFVFAAKRVVLSEAIQKYTGGVIAVKPKWRGCYTSSDGTLVLNADFVGKDRDLAFFVEAKVAEQHVIFYTFRGSYRNEDNLPVWLFLWTRDEIEAAIQNSGDPEVKKQEWYYGWETNWKKRNRVKQIMGLVEPRNLLTSEQFTEYKNAAKKFEWDDAVQIEDIDLEALPLGGNEKTTE